MIRYQKNKNSMLATVHAFVTENSAVYSDTEEFVSGIAKLENLLVLIKNKEDERSTVATGKTKYKNVSRKSVSDFALMVAGAIYAYGKKSENVVLTEKVNISATFLTSLRNHDLVRVLESIMELAEENIAAIVPFGITAEKLSEYKARVTQYSKALSAKDSSGASKTSAAKSLRQLFKDSDNVTDTLDKLVEGFKESNAAFYNGYKAARVTKNLGIRHDQPVQLNAGSPVIKASADGQSLVSTETDPDNTSADNALNTDQK